MFLHHSMTDSEILASCVGCESPHLRLVAGRLRDRADDIADAARMADEHARVAADIEMEYQRLHNDNDED